MKVALVTLLSFALMRDNASTQQPHYTSENLTFDHPAGWTVKDSRGPYALSVHLQAPGSSLVFYIAVRRVPKTANPQVEHQRQIDFFLQESPEWRRAGGTVAEAWPAGSGLTTILQRVNARDRQFVTSFCAGGLLALTSVEVPEASPDRLAARETVLRSLTFGPPSIDSQPTHDAEPSARQLVGRWVAGPEVLTFWADGRVAYELTRTSYNAVTLPVRNGRYEVQGSSFLLHWPRQSSWLAEEDICVFRVSDERLVYRCKSGAQEISLLRSR
jgi:hypothetical protein